MSLLKCKILDVINIMNNFCVWFSSLREHRHICCLDSSNPMQWFQQNFSFLKSDINQARNSSMLIIVKRKNRKYWKKLLLVHLILMLVLRNVIHTIISEPQDNCNKISISFNVVRIFQVFLYPQTNVALAIYIYIFFFLLPSVSFLLFA